MASLTEQMELLQKQQEILAKKIKEEEERKRKLNNEASIERLEALIDPITQYLDNTEKDMHNSHSGITRLSIRERFTNNFEIKERDRLMKNQNKPFHLQNHITNIMYKCDHMLANEEIFVTMLGILKKQEERIKQLESR